MFTVRRLMMTCALLASTYAQPGFAERCEPDQSWHHTHSAAKPDTISDDIKGNRATTIEVCRDEVASGAKLTTTLQFEGQRKPSPLEQGKCEHRLAKWAIVRSVGAQASADTPAEAKGRYRICKD